MDRKKVTEGIFLWILRIISILILMLAVYFWLSCKGKTDIFYETFK
jgi:hypothetical protein